MRCHFLHKFPYRGEVTIRARVQHRELTRARARNQGADKLGQRLLGQANLFREDAGFAEHFNGGEPDKVADELEHAGLAQRLVGEFDDVFAYSAVVR